MVLVYSPGRELTAQVTCTGAACDILPENIRFQLNQVDTAIQAQYTDKVLSTMTEAAVLGNINSAMMGPGIVNRFQIGGGVTLAGQKKQDVDIVSQDLVFRGLPNVGASVAPNINIAFNLGWLMGDGPSDTVSEYSSFLHRFNVYLHGFQYNFAQSDVQDIIKRQDDKINLSGDIANYGFMIRFHVVPNYSDGIGIFEFSGISIGTGVHYQRQNFSLLYNDPTSQAVTLGPSIGTWGGFPTLNYKSSVTSIPLDVRTGFRMFYVLTLFVGVGTSLNFGNSSLEFQKQGPLSLRVEDALISSNLTPAQQAALANLTGTTETGTLSIGLRGKGNAPNNLSYVVGGFELNVGFVKLLFEAMASKNIQSANVGVKIAF
ncbi:MAG: hypothetical protein JJT78_07840 [Leptospira sp.]|nr:hypothetical protein [Leptospira sp.]